MPRLLGFGASWRDESVGLGGGDDPFRAYRLLAFGGGRTSRARDAQRAARDRQNHEPRVPARARLRVPGAEWVWELDASAFLRFSEPGTYTIVATYFGLTSNAANVTIALP